MKLKKITIYGFKSFADKVSLDFNCDILAIVGPNGCGKSNVVDAFRWVLGEARAGSFRADKMQDVLFAGGENRKPANYAEVTLVLSDIQGELNLPYEEISITRKLYRDGESDYLLNKNQVRLKDIQDLLLGSGLGKNAFSVFEQGKLDAVIHLSPLQRRSIFDEAAGTSRFLQRKKETLKRLSTATENYVRIKDIHVEVEKKTKNLKRQAAQAKAFQENKEALKSLEKKVLVEKWKQVFEKRGALLKNLEHVKSLLDEKRNQHAAVEKQLEALALSYSEKETEAQSLQKKLYEKKTQHEIEKTKFKEKRQQLESAKKREKAIAQEIEQLAKRKESEKEKSNEKRKNLEILLGRVRELEGEVARRSEIKQSIEKQTTSLREELQRISNRYLKEVGEEKKLYAELQKKIFQEEAKKGKLEKISKDISDKKFRMHTLEKDASQKKKEVSALTEEIDLLKKNLEKVEKDFKSLQKQLEALKEENGKVQAKWQSIVVKEETLLRLKEQFEGFSAGSKKLMLEAKNPKSPLFQKMRPLFEALPSKQAANGSLFLYGDTLVVEKESDLDAILRFTENKKISNFSLFCLSSLKSQAGIEEHFLSEIQSFDSLSLALKAGKESVSADGNFYVTRHGVLFSLGAKKDVFQREVELKALAQEKGETKKRLEELQNALLEGQAKLQEEESSLKTLSLAHRKKEMSLVQENFSLQRLYNDIAALKKEAEDLEKEKAALMEKKEESSQDALEEALKEKQHEIASMLAIQKEKEASYQSCEQKLKAASFDFDKSQKELQNLFSEKQKSENEIFQISMKEKQLQEESARHDKELLRLKKAMEETDAFLAEGAYFIEREEKDIQQLQASYQSGEESLKELKKEKEKLAKSHSILSTGVQTAEKEVYKAEIIEQAEETKLKTLEEELKAKHGLEKEALSSKEHDLNEKLEDAEKKMQELKLALEKTEGINLSAIDEFREEEERFQFLSAQLHDLETAKKDLETVVEKLDSESRKIFRKTYEKIRANFQKNFTLLFNGGEADLKFTDSHDVLEAGIEIVAKPPGKQMRSIGLLSGGEKCLTALALLFAIFEEKPSPFCIMDEVDAPLDDSNVDRFTNMLRAYTGKTQFILVTHNKKTMRVADILIGISMEEKGVSKLISLAFEKRFAGTNV